MALAVVWLLLTALTGYLVWRVTERFWQLIVIVALTGAVAAAVCDDDHRRCLMVFARLEFSDGPAGKDEVIVASVVATLLLAIIVAAGLFATARAAWRRWRG